MPRFDVKPITAVPKKEYRDKIYEGVIGKKVVLNAIVKISETHLLLEFEYIKDKSKAKNWTIKESIMFKKGRFQKELNLPRKYGDTFTKLTPGEDYDVYTGYSSNNHFIYTLILKNPDH